MSTRKKIPGQFNEDNLEETAKGIADIAKEIVEKSEQQKITERTQSEHIENTEGTRFKSYKTTDLETFSIRLRPVDKKRLQAYYEKRGLTLSQGIRTIIKDFMERQGI
jgi:hypothetical protein